MDRLRSTLENGKLEPVQLLPLVTKWICEKGSASQLIEWVNGLSREKAEIFRALNACSDSEATEMEERIGPVINEAGFVPVHVQAEVDGPSEKASR